MSIKSVCKYDADDCKACGGSLPYCYCGSKY